MTRRDQAINWLQGLPDPLFNEAADFIEFLHQKARLVQPMAGVVREDESVLHDLNNYDQELRSYEDRLAAGEIKRW